VHPYLMRPEAVEAFFVLWRLTGKTRYREYGWGVFQAIEKWCKVSGPCVMQHRIQRAIAMLALCPPSTHVHTHHQDMLGLSMQYCTMTSTSVQQ